MKKNKLCKHLFFVILLTAFFVGNAFAQNFKGKVVGVVDGDTVTVLDSQNRQITVRLAGIDAPEKRQDFGEAARQHLANLIFQKKVTIVAGKKDRYGRTVGKILLNGKDINLAMIQSGYAWHYKEYEDEQSETDRALYAQAEINARKLLSGLWVQPNAVKPSVFRQQKTTAQSDAPRQTEPRRIILPVPNSGGESSGGSSGSSSGGNKTVEVKGYTRKDGTYVRPHTRSAPKRKN